MLIALSRVIQAPIEDVFAWFDDPANLVQTHDHAVRVEVVDTRPDGRRTFDIVMRAGAKEWMQTAEQIVREPPTRIVTRGGTWTTDRHDLLLALSTDRRFTTEGQGTRMEVTIETRLLHPFRRPFHAIVGWLQQGSAQETFERQLDWIAGRLEAGAWPSPRR